MAAADPPVFVVTPFFNTEAYLAECIDSVLAQTYAHFEYVLVDNQSTDGSIEIAASYARRDSRIRVVRTPCFLPQVQNYNFAIEQMPAESLYCKMVQADDWLLPRCLEEMVPLAEAHPSAAIVSSYRMIEAAVSGAGLHPKRAVISGKEAGRMHLRREAFLFGSPTTALYRADVVRSRRPFFREGRFHEDTEAAFEILADRDFAFVHQVLSFSRRQEDSLMTNARRFHPYILDHYILSSRYGSLYLDVKEHATHLRDARAWLYSTLASRWLRERLGPIDEEFWRYQSRGLATIGERIQPMLIARHAAARVVRKALCPFGLAKHGPFSSRRTRDFER